MTHEPDKEQLSAYLDGELAPPEKQALTAHLDSCPLCARYLARIRAASADFRRHGAEEAPASVLAARARGRGRRRLWDIAAFVAIALGVGMVAGAALKHFMPGLFSQIQGMISGAAADLGK